MSEKYGKFADKLGGSSAFFSIRFRSVVRSHREI